MMKKIWILLAIGFLTACSTPADISNEVEPTIFGGVEAEPHEFPFMAAVEISFGGGVGGGCGGIILSEDWVVTAAHCTANSESIEVVAGQHTKSVDEGSEQAVEVKNIIIPDNRKVDDTLVDIALLELAEPLKLNDKVQPMAYASQMPADGTTLTAIGWGRDQPQGGRSSDTLRKVNLVLDQGIGCFGEDTLLCTVETTDKGTSAGDSGGPIFENDKRLLLGLNSFSPVSRDRTFFTRVPSYANWIEEKTGIAPNSEGAEPQPEPEPEPEPEEPSTPVYEGNLEEGKTTIQPDGTFFRSEAGTQSATLSGPEDANFDLYLYEWSGASWEFVARGTNTDSSESLSYEGKAGYYAWLVYARTGSGSYSLEIERP